jgi:phospholipid-binding lipoprotein MlaA
MLAFTTATMIAALSGSVADALPMTQVTTPVEMPATTSTPTTTPAPTITPAQDQTRPTGAVPPVATKPRQTSGKAGAANAASDIVVVGRKRDPGDPLRSVNAQAFGATQAVDKAVVGPVARVYQRKVPSPIRRGIHNFLYNLREPIVFVNFLLQFKPGKAAETVGRFLVNTTAGIGGVLDVAKKRPFRLPRRSNGFANTLGYHGVKNGPFLFLPLVGPTTVRDLVGGTLDRLLLPAAVGSPFTDTSYTAPAGVLGALDHRADFDETLKCLHDDASDPYASSRAFYLHRRQAEIDHLHRRPPAPAPFCEDALPATRRLTPNSDGTVDPTPVGAPPPVPLAVPPAVPPAAPLTAPTAVPSAAVPSSGPTEPAPVDQTVPADPAPVPAPEIR